MTGRAICFQLGPSFPTCEGCGLRGSWLGDRGFAGLVLGGLARLEGGGGGAPGRVSGSPGLFFPPLSQAETGHSPQAPCKAVDFGPALSASRHGILRVSPA